MEMEKPRAGLFFHFVQSVWYKAIFNWRLTGFNYLMKRPVYFFSFQMQVVHICIDIFHIRCTILTSVRYCHIFVLGPF